MDNPEIRLEEEELMSGITSIQQRSGGLMKFAQTYRSLNKVTHVNKTLIKAVELFKNIEDLIQPTLTNIEVNLQFEVDEKDLVLKIDTYLIEQVLINLILNAIDATQGQSNPQVRVMAT